ncbi:MAG: DNA translocase FtsK, partial [Christensenella sp.]
NVRGGISSAKKYIKPPLNLLNMPTKGARTSTANLKKNVEILENTLASFNVNAKVVNVSHGPVVTRYEIQPAPGVKVSKIVNLADDIAMNLSARDVRIEAPVPGKPVVGIEVPNLETSSVGLRELVGGEEFKQIKSPIAFALGKDIAGANVYADIAKMPHLLIAGATGSGKSVCINSLIISMLYHASPEDVRMIMIDPKVVELNIFNDIPHLLIPVVTD